MKVVASTKLAKAQKAMRAGKQYGIANAGKEITHGNINKT